ELCEYRLQCVNARTTLFSENEAIIDRLFRVKNTSPLGKDSFRRYVIHGEIAAVNPQLTGTKAAVHYKFTVPPGGEVSIKLRLRKDHPAIATASALGKDFESTFAARKSEANEFYANIIPSTTGDDTRNVM